MREVDRKLWLHIAECLGIQDRKLTEMHLHFEIDELATIQTTEIVSISGSEPTFQVKRFQLVDADGHNTTT